MTEAPSAPQQTVVVAQPAPPPRWPAYVTVGTSIIGALGLVVAALVTIGAWRASVDVALASLDRRLTKAERNQETYIPVLLGLSKDVTYLADRARREDDRRARQGQPAD